MGIMSDRIFIGERETFVSFIQIALITQLIFYRVTIHVVPNLLLKSKQKFRLSMRPM